MARCKTKMMKKQKTFYPNKWQTQTYIKWFIEVSNQEFCGNPDELHKEIKLLSGC